MSPTITDDEVELIIRRSFERNYDLLRQEGGHVLAEGAKRQALEQTLLYWRKLKAIATAVTETEVKLALPGQRTPKGRPFVIEGIVDIVREGDKVQMYDLKTHEASEVRAEREVYEDQLNVYAHVWQQLRQQPLDGTAIIATRLPTALRAVLRAGDPAAINAAMDAWDPVVDLSLDANEVARTVKEFGRCVDAIEDGQFEAPSPQRLAEPLGRHGKRDVPTTFAQVHCQNCDARFSCESYDAYLQTRGGASAELTDAAEEELDAWIEENLGDGGE